MTADIQTRAAAWAAQVVGDPVGQHVVEDLLEALREAEAKIADRDERINDMKEREADARYEARTRD